MTDIRCPMCGKPNPVDLFVCQFCEARLKPLIVNPLEGEGGSILSRPRKNSDEEPDTGLPDWLRGLQGQETGEEAGEDELALPDWMQDDSEASELSAESSSSPVEEPDTFDWLSRLGETDGEPDTETPNAVNAIENDAPGEPDWLQEIRVRQEQEQVDPEFAGDEINSDLREEAESQIDNGADWFSGLESGEEQTSFTAEQDSASSVPDWFAPAGLSSLPEDGKGSAADTPVEFSDWLEEIGQDGSVEQAEANDPEAGGMLDWLASGDLDNPTKESEYIPKEDVAPEIPDWFGAIEMESKEELAEARDTDAGDVSDWFASADLDSLTNEGEDSSKVDAPAEMQDWFGEDGLETGKEPSESPAEDAQSDDFMDWFAEVGRGHQFDQDENLPDESTGLEALPDWFAEAGLVSEEPDEVSTDGVQPGGPPDWFDSTGLQDVEELENEPLAGKDDAAVGLPAWLDAAAQPEYSEQNTAPAFTDQPNQQHEAVPDWLKKLEAENSSQKSESESAPIPLFEVPVASDEQLEQSDAKLDESDLEALPEWINQVSDETTAGGAGDSEKASDSSLAQSELPSWLEAMRPVESIVALSSAAEKEGPVEKAGPLAGLQSVLPAQAEFSEIKKPPTYSVKLQVTENQQLHSKLLENLLASESEPKQLLDRPIISSQLLLRLAVAVILITSLVVSRLVNVGITPMPAANQNEAVVQASSIVNNLMPGSPVLLAVDYEPGFSGELDVAASGLVRQVIQQGGRLVMVSTLPDGAVNAERFLGSLKQVSEEPFRGYVNLGFVTGGAAGLRTFAETPRLVFPFTLDTLRVWESHPFDTVETVADFHLVVVITENPVTARTWIEQVQPVMQNNFAPLIMIVSAQIEPLVRPYYDAFPRQVAGLIAGVPGGAAYESQTGITGRAVNAWDSFSMGLLVGAVLLLSGGAISAVLTILSRRKEAEVE
jgi:hypothetical protein